MKIFVNAVYGVGAMAVLVLGAICLFGSKQPVFPDAMLPYSQRELAFIWLAIGSIPMCIACAAACSVNKLGDGKHPRRNQLLVCLPGILSGGCLLFIFGLVMASLITTQVL